MAGGAMTLPELTVRGIALGGLITLLFTAANVYLGLKVGLTFATSIPAAVISMAVLRFFASSNILENNIVQTVASAAGTLAAICFVLPGLVMVGWWQGFPFWTTALVTALGGLLGVMFSIPLRRALVAESDLPYPEGRAAAEVLKVGEGSRSGDAESAAGLRVIVTSTIVAGAFNALTYMRFAVSEASHFFRIGPSATGIAGGLSFALLGAGHLVGLTVGLAMFTGLVIGWGIATPWLTALAAPAGDAESFATGVWLNQVRFIGAGVIGVAAIWTLLRIIGPILSGIRSAMAASRARRVGGEGLPRKERDIPIGIVALVSGAALIPITFLLMDFIDGGPLAGISVPLIAVTLVFVLLVGAFIASVCGYMAGLIGASNSPISGVGILAILAASMLFGLLFSSGLGEGSEDALIAYALLATAIVFGVATISNDNLQDLKTGQLVGATPWRQQVALVFGVLFGSMVIPPVLELLNAAYGFAGAPGAGPNALPAPQAALISALGSGVLGGDLDWSLIGIGAALGVVIVIIDELLARTGKARLHPLGVGIGIYLPMGTTMTVVVGAVLGWFYDRAVERRAADPERAKRMGVLTATGMIVGESLFGVAYAGLVVGSGSDAPLALVGDSFRPIALIGGTLLFAATAWWLYRRAIRASASLAAT
ncbi:oligopeptide transporter, OPT family [Sphingosinicella humi]|uniref:Oligopeptide transporter, OPT family n=2 Tax=Allosphingosinicella humi TaxID=2068657 RepID=A0A2U2J656_9SPHN|nr:oligopeptide transporter, OPT family [Sphingosinicella humi]